MATVPKDMMDVIHAMNGEGPTTERVPMLSDEQLKFFTAKDVRDYYEHLITTGKLRVVEEVAAVEDTEAMRGNDLDTETCQGCGAIWSMRSYPFAATSCPVCSNTIKR